MGVIKRFQERWTGYLGKFGLIALLIAAGYILRMLLELAR